MLKPEIPSNFSSTANGSQDGFIFGRTTARQQHVGKAVMQLTAKAFWPAHKHNLYSTFRSTLEYYKVLQDTVSTRKKKKNEWTKERGKKHLHTERTGKKHLHTGIIDFTVEEAIDHSKNDYASGVHTPHRYGTE